MPVDPDGEQDAKAMPNFPHYPWLYPPHEDDPEREAARIERIRNTDTPQAIAELAEIYKYGLTLPPKQVSGLVEMQKHLSKLWPKQPQD
jgi:hypothetical protein